MAEKITNIEEVFCIHGQDGYKVVTTEHSYLVLIENGQHCCEQWGYMTSEDDIERFIGAELYDVILTDTSLNQEKLRVESLYESDCQFVDFSTNKGVFQIAVYNNHNGYYGHNIRVLKDNCKLLDMYI